MRQLAVLVRLTMLVWLLLPLGGCFVFKGDGATNIAYRLESEVKQLRDSGAQSRTFDYVPPGGFDNCSDAYRVQFSESSSLVVWCKGKNGETVSSHTTTYHLNFVKVPKTWIVEKQAGEAMRVELTRQGGDVAITDVR